jgi:2-phospho-L-lactate guanylyltransferase
MRVVVPFGVREPATRLDPLLSTAERKAFAGQMLADVLIAVRAAGGDPELLADAPVADSITGQTDVTAPVTVDERPLTTAINNVIAGATGPVAIVMSDLALATPRAVRRLWNADSRGDNSGGDVVIAPGRGGGTNALVVNHPEFRVDYHGASYLDHLRVAHEIGATVREVDSMRLATDIDEPADLAELLVHGDGAAADWLREAGFELDVSDGRVDVVREA